jgi:hypothetical protein
MSASERKAASHLVLHFEIRKFEEVDLRWLPDVVKTTTVREMKARWAEAPGG